jgi:beta-1,4-mannosyl-glycoprotein beta-1,4-N-acetylglucosaminyltransferase
MRVLDCTTYYEEDLMMDLRFNVLNNYVDKFIVSEATFTHSGNPKKIKFNPNNFKKFKNKIIHIIVDDDPVSKINKDTNDTGLKRLNSIKRIEFQRNEIFKAIDKTNDNDYVIYSDNDEIPNLDNIDLSKNKSKIVLFKQKLYYYKFNLSYPKVDWFGSKACKIKDLKNISWLRNIKTKKYNLLRLDTLFSDTKYINLKIVENGGWHFTNLKTPEELYRKYLNDEMHSEFETKEVNLKDIENKVVEKKVNYNHFIDSRSSIQDKQENQFNLIKVNLDLLPDYIKNNVIKYKDWID